MPRYVAADLSLHCLPMSLKKDARLIWVNTIPMATDSVYKKMSIEILRNSIQSVVQMNKKI